MTHCLGETEWQSGWRILGFLTASEVVKLGQDLIKFINMTTDPPYDLRTYPNAAGCGGVGIQFYQPLTESWLIIGTWPQHGFFRVNLSSCKPYDYGAATVWLARYGPIQQAFNYPL